MYIYIIMYVCNKFHRYSRFSVALCTIHMRNHGSNGKHLIAQSPMQESKFFNSSGGIFCDVRVRTCIQYSENKTRQ